MSYEFLEVEKDIVKHNPNRETWIKPNVRGAYLEVNYEPMDHIILKIIRLVAEEQGKEYVSSSDIEMHPLFEPEWSAWKLEDSLIRLNNLGKLIKSNIGNGYKILYLND